jgi:hypothetical protein
MALIRRTWTPEAADEWTKEDWIVIVISPLAYFFITIGTALSCLLFTSGFILLGVGIVLTAILHWVIDPKLKAISHEYELKQAHYVEEIERTTRWEKK